MIHFSLSAQSIWTKAFWVAAAERAISTGAQCALVAWGGGTLPWWTVPAFFAGGAVLATLKGLAVNVATGNGPGATGAESVNDDAY